MRHFISLGIILDVLLQSKPAYTESYSSPPASNESSMQSLEARQDSTVVAPSEFLRRASHASAVVGSFLYIDGGDFSFTDNGHTDYQYSNALLSINLSQNWTNGSVTIMPNVKPSGVPSLKEPSLWYHEQEGLLYTGFAGDTSIFGNSPSLPPQSVWSFKPDGTGSGSWNEVISPNTSALSGITQPCAGLTAYGPDSAWYLGGFPAKDGFGWNSTMQWLPGMVEFDMASKSFTNSSATEYNANGTVIRGGMHYVPSFGQNGIVLVMGGITLPYYTAGLVSFETLSIFDPAKKEWFNQTTTGNAPSPREQFCVAGISSTNNTYEIFVYGGKGALLGLDAVQYDTINILTLPAFHWISVLYNPQNPRSGHTCNAVGGSQIITIGGVDANSNITQYGNTRDNVISTYNTSADPFSQGLAIFDMTALSFLDGYTASANAYEQSDPIKEFYSSSQNAYQQNLTPGVAALLQITNFTDAITSTTVPNTATSTPLPSISPQASPSPQPSTSHHYSAGTIAGSIIGALAMLASLGTGAIYFLKCQKTRKAATSNKQRFIEEAPDTSIGWLNELPGGGRPPELKDQALVEMGSQPLVEMGRDQRRPAWEAVEIGQLATPEHVHEL